MSNTGCVLCDTNPYKLAHLEKSVEIIQDSGCTKEQLKMGQKQEEGDDKYMGKH